MFIVHPANRRRELIFRNILSIFYLNCHHHRKFERCTCFIIFLGPKTRVNQNKPWGGLTGGATLKSNDVSAKVRWPSRFSSPRTGTRCAKRPEKSSSLHLGIISEAPGDESADGEGFLANLYFFQGAPLTFLLVWIVTCVQDLPPSIGLSNVAIEGLRKEAYGAQGGTALTSMFGAHFEFLVSLATLRPKFNFKEATWKQ